ncbi:MAG: type II secretion system protein [Candidatus Saccharibacteria bacterium]|nr:type II secretion system protein [Candidatus Saccharibacteria bacterium]
MTHTNKKGFTIIEVVLVLAIAGLIFAMVFIALPAMQRGQRDNGRKSDASTVAAAVNTYKSNNKTFNGITDTKLQQYVDKLNQYDVGSIRVHINRASVQVGKDDIIVSTKRKCPSSLPGPTDSIPATIQLDPGTASTAAVVVLLENNGSKAQLHCVEI